MYFYRSQGCIDKVVSWLRNTADILFVLGYCVIAFLKLSFLGILRYEIKEMIQKIKLLQTELACSILGPEAEQQQVNHFVFLFICLRFDLGRNRNFVLLLHFILLHAIGGYLTSWVGDGRLQTYLFT